jgi:hypothetical protein
MVKTAREFYDEHYSIDAVVMMRDFAKLHVEAALKAASEVYIKVEKKSQYGKYRKWQKVKEGEEVDLFNYQMQYSQDKESILNAYPLENIK